MARCRCRAHMHAVPTTTRCAHRVTRTSRQHCTAAPHACGVILPCSTEECLGSCWRRARLGRAGVRAQQRPGPRGGPARDFLCSPAGARVRRLGRSIAAQPPTKWRGLGADRFLVGFSYAGWLSGPAGRRSMRPAALSPPCA